MDKQGGSFLMETKSSYEPAFDKVMDILRGKNKQPTRPYRYEWRENKHLSIDDPRYFEIAVIYLDEGEDVRP